MQTEFTPLTALIGGGPIGMAATVLYAGMGRIAGTSGILNPAIEQRQGRTWRLACLLGLIGSAGLWLWRSGALPREGFRYPRCCWPACWLASACVWAMAAPAAMASAAWRGCPSVRWRRSWSSCWPAVRTCM